MYKYVGYIFLLIIFLDAMWFNSTMLIQNILNYISVESDDSDDLKPAFLGMLN